MLGLFFSTVFLCVVMFRLQHHHIFRLNDRGMSAMAPVITTPTAVMSQAMSAMAPVVTSPTGVVSHIGLYLGRSAIKTPAFFLTVVASTLSPSEAWKCCVAGKSCGGPGCGLCAHDIERASARCSGHGDAHRDQWYHDTCGRCSQNSGPWYCVCFAGYVGSQCESLVSPYPTVSPTQSPTVKPYLSYPERPTYQRTELNLQCSPKGYFEIQTKPFNYQQRLLIGYGLGETCDVIMEMDPHSIYSTPTSELISFPVMGNGSHGTVYHYDDVKKQHCFRNNIFILFGFHQNDYIQPLICCYDSLIDFNKELPKIPEPVWKEPVKKEGDL